MQIKFASSALLELFETGKTKDRRYQKIQKNKKLLQGYLRVVQVMQQVSNIDELKDFSFLHYERLKHKYSGQSSVRLLNGSVERLLFTESQDGIVVEIIEIDSTHYGNR